MSDRPQQVVINSPLDMHLHFREGAMAQTVIPLSSYSFAGGVIMPNLVPAVNNLERLTGYLQEIKSIVGDDVFQPYMTVFFKDYSYEELEQFKPHILGIKLYPAGVTTNSEDGVAALDRVETTIKYMEELEIPLLVHGETHGFVLDREKLFLPIFEHLANKFPRLKIIMEHITTAEAVALLDRYENIFATVTLHHLIITLDDLAGGLLRPHLFCKPIAKRPEDREALLKAAIAAHPKLMFGSDSAPHPIDKKEACGCAAGIFTAPIALAALAELFAKHNALDRLQAFVSDNAQKIYDIIPPQKFITLESIPFKVPATYGDVVPMFAEREISWSITKLF
ncbi:dihydroorotase [Waterburya agarophytonicola K14]|uniref:Dihydroorotase n=1 Tax=Waterburya agarophytonicola KI4 TaxID=2874699 RepID=A0A964BSW8_9CYAN|nr:dihydroorotase [Waterburya agarophytonicola]MCC0177631.1 dihydroorotase [Waterburya agarophytonicola KI4]